MLISDFLNFLSPKLKSASDLICKYLKSVSFATSSVFIIIYHFDFKKSWKTFHGNGDNEQHFFRWCHSLIIKFKVLAEKKNVYEACDSNWRSCKWLLNF